MLLERGTADKQFRAGLLFCETLGELDQHPSIGGIPDFPEGNDEPQSFDNIQVDFIVAKQLQQLVPAMIGIVDIQRKYSGIPKKMASSKKWPGRTRWHDLGRDREGTPAEHA